MSNPEKFADEKLVTENLHPIAYQKLSEKQDNARAGIAVQESTNATLDGARAVANPLLQTSGIYDPNITDPTKQSSEYQTFYSHLDQWLGNFEAQNKRGPKNSELTEGVNNLLQQVVMPGAIYGTNTKRMYQLTPTDETRAKMPPEAAPYYTKVFQQIERSRAPMPSELNDIFFWKTFHSGDQAMENQIVALIHANSDRLKQGLPAAPNVPQETVSAGGKSEEPQQPFAEKTVRAAMHLVKEPMLLATLLHYYESQEGRQKEQIETDAVLNDPLTSNHPLSYYDTRPLPRALAAYWSMRGAPAMEEVKDWEKKVPALGMAALWAWQKLNQGGEHTVGDLARKAAAARPPGYLPEMGPPPNTPNDEE
ncbi:MAG: hypothetical protein P4L55_08380 [Syntrophobacteraceae bacterium]|nr:hypothetical protein [Syntrophobacteraceae bacterium]